MAHSLQLRNCHKSLITNGELLMRPNARTKDLDIRRDTAELFVKDLTRHKEIYLNPTSAYVWQKCDGKRNASEIAKEMAKELGIIISEKVVSLALNRLAEDHLLELEVA